MAYFYHQVTEKEKRQYREGKKHHMHKLASFSLMIGIYWQKAEEVKYACRKIWLEHCSCIFHILGRWQRWSSDNCSPKLESYFEMQPNMLRKCQWYCDLISESYTDGHRRICEVTRLLFIMHKFHIELNHDSKYKMQYIIYTKSAPKRLFFFSLWKAFFHNRHLFMVMPFWCLCGIECEIVCVFEALVNVLHDFSYIVHLFEMKWEEHERKKRHI